MVNYQKQLDVIIAGIRNAGSVPALLLHSCCAPCSSYVLEYLSDFFSITVFYFNPNIYPEREYECRKREQMELISRLETKHAVSFIDGDFNPDLFYKSVKGFEHEPECGMRCGICYRIRLEETAKVAKGGAYDYFCTTLSISPLKNAEKINDIGNSIGADVGIPFLPSDFKKRNGYKRSIELSRTFNLYRQGYCGCVFSFRQWLDKQPE